jgi:hypothetical protein
VRVGEVFIPGRHRCGMNLPKSCGHRVKGYSSFKEIPEWQKRDALSRASTSSRP